MQMGRINHGDTKGTERKTELIIGRWSLVSQRYSNSSNWLGLVVCCICRCSVENS